MELQWSYIKKVSTGMVDEKVTVISSFLLLMFWYGTEAGNALAAIGFIHEGDSHILR
jgi:hypothetical protein